MNMIVMMVGVNVETKGIYRIEEGAVWTNHKHPYDIVKLLTHVQNGAPTSKMARLSEK